MNTPETEVIMNHLLQCLNVNSNGPEEKKEIDLDFTSLVECI